MSKNLFLTKGANVEDLVNAVPKNTVESGFSVVGDTIEYVGNPKALKFVIPIMVSVVKTLDGFEVVRTPKTYIKKDGTIGSTNITTFSFRSREDAQILCDNVNAVCKARYEEYLSNKEKNNK